MFACNHKIWLSGLAITASSYSVAVVPVDFSNLVEQVAPAVVSVTAKRTPTQQEMMQDQIPELFLRFFGHQIIIPQQRQPREQSAYGTAFFISQDGYLLTNRHVIDGATDVTITLNDRREYDAKVVGSDERTDVAVLKVKGEHFPTLNIGSADGLRVGEPVLAIGSPFGFDYSASAGIVSAKSRTMSSETTVPFIQTDVALNPGNSGGPLFNQKGDVVGINSRIFSGTGGYMGLSFSIPIDVAMNVANQLRTTGKVVRPYLGVMLQDVDRNLAEAYNLPKPEGTLITQVADDSPAQKAGLKAGDVVLKFNGRKIDRTSDLVNQVGQSQLKQQVEIEVLRDGQHKTLKATLTAAPNSDTASANESKTSTDSKTQNAGEKLGIVLRALAPFEQSRLNVQGVVIQDVAYQGLAAQSGLRPMDVVVKLDNRPVANLADFQKVYQSVANKAVVPVYLLRQGQPMILGLKLKSK